MTPRLKVGIAAALLFRAGSSRAEMSLEKAQWQLVKRERPAAAPKAQDIDALKIDGPKLAGRLRAKLRIVNSGAKAVEGILLRYSLTAKISPEDGKQEGVWAVPFMIEERRVPKVGPNETLEVPLETSPQLELYLKRKMVEGFRPEELKLQVMIEPRRGEASSIKVLESSLKLAR